MLAAVRSSLPPLAAVLAQRRFGVIHVLALAALIFAVAAFNGRPSFFGDTPIYYSQGEYLAGALGFPPSWMAPQRPFDLYSVMPGASGFANRGAVAVAAARSPVYGLLLFLSQRIGTLWLLVGVQALAASWAVYLLISRVAPQNALKGFYASGLVLALGTTLPFFAAFAMPDIFAGVAILCAVTLLLLADKLSWGERAGAWAMICFAAAAHRSNAMTLLGLAVIAAGVLLITGVTWRRIAIRCGALLLAIAAAFSIGMVCGKIYEHGTGLKQVAPPFLTARVLADGPGRAYLAAHCPGGAAPLLCHYAGRTFQDEEEFLWSRKPNVGVYALADYGVQLQLQREETPFVLHAVAEHPLQQLAAMAGNWAQQLTLFRLTEPIHNPAEFLTQRGWRNTSIWQVLPGRAQCEQQPSYCRPRLPRSVLWVWQGLVMVIAVAILVMAAISSDIRAAVRSSDPKRRGEIDLAVTAVVLIGLAVVINAAVCGAFSGPYPRYEARLIWLVPLSAVMLCQLLPLREALARLKPMRPQGRFLTTQA